ncbi:MAG: Do family serine endopeptidase [Polyangiaceae bacterium]
MKRFSLFAFPVASALVLGSLAACGNAAQHSPTAAAPSAALAPVVIASAAPPFAVPPTLPGTVDVPALVGKTRPAVVNIMVERTRAAFESHGDTDGMPDPFDLFRKHGGRIPEGPQRSSSQGSGFIVNPKGLVVTNAHVVEGATGAHANLSVKLADGRTFKAKVKGRDAKLDLAVLELEGASDLPTVVLGGSEAVQVGEYVVAIGNPFGLGHTVTMGIVSAKGRTIGAGPYDDFIQTDASINPGNSGGPLFNLRGEVVGINTAINPAGRGIGFAIPSDTLKEVLPQLVSRGSVARGKIGVVVQPIDDGIAKALHMDKPRGALVADLQAGSPGAKAGLKAGDVITAVDGVEVSESKDLPKLVAKHAPGSKVTLKLLRDGKPKDVVLELAEMKDDVEPDDDDKDPSPKSSSTTKPKFGLELQDAKGGGALITKTLPGGAAADLASRGDIIVQINGKPVQNAKEAARILDGAKTGETMLLQLRRDGKTRFVGIEAH